LGTEQLIFDDEQNAQDYCLNNAESVKEYNKCISKIKVRQLKETTEGTYATYKFAIRAYAKDASDVAYATLTLREELPLNFQKMK